jgi:peptide/nickel transport system ATP-binding protein
MPGRPSVQSEAVNESAGTHRKSKRRKDAPLLLDVRNLSVNYVNDNDQTVAKAVYNVSLQLHEGELIGLVGESGCGKTTLMLALMRLLPAAGQIANGHIFFQDKDITQLSEEELEQLRWSGISIIFQGAMNALNPVRTIGDQIKEAILKHIPSYPPGSLDDRVVELLDLVGIAKDHKDQYPHQYSGGMRQRAMIAMALSCDPEVVIADEPTTALDVMIQAQILELLDDLRKKLGLAIIFVTHDLGVVAEMCDSVLVMYGGVTAEYADVDTIYNAPRHPYTQELLKSFPDLSQPEKRLVSIPGYPPKLDELPAGCRFAPRCPLAFERCTTEMPKLHELEDGYHLASCHLVEGGK